MIKIDDMYYNPDRIVAVYPDPKDSNRTYILCDSKDPFVVKLTIETVIKRLTDPCYIVRF